MSKIKGDTVRLEKFISDLNSYSLAFKNHADQFNDSILKTESCWHGEKADEYRNLANSFNKIQFETFYLTLSNLIDRLSSLQSSLESTIDSNKGD